MQIKTEKYISPIFLKQLKNIFGRKSILSLQNIY